MAVRIVGAAGTAGSDAAARLADVGSGGSAGAATTSTAGIVALATTAEAQAGTDGTKAMTPARVVEAIQTFGAVPATRTTAAVTTSSLAANAVWQGSITLAQGYRLLKIQTSAAARVRLYIGSTYQAADLSRGTNKAPTGDHGVVLDYVTTASLLSSMVLPVAEGDTINGGSSVPITVTNNSGGTTTITVTLTWIKTE